jgi:two-component system C4-dicarboxylate transport response regulator DctD
MGGYKILIVEDEAELSDLMASELRQQNLEVFVAGDGAAGLQLLQNGQRPDLILSDIAMPVMDGFAFLKEVFLIDPSFYVMMVTAFGDSEKVIRALRLGVRDFVEKPFSMEDFVDKVFVNLEIAKALKSPTQNTKLFHMMRVKNSQAFKKAYSDF